MRKLTPKQHQFVLAYIVPGTSLSEAYRLAYKPSAKALSATINKQAYNISKLPHVSSMITLEKQRLAERYDISVEKITDMLKEAARRALDAGELETYRKASMDLAKLGGLLVSKTEVNSRSVSEVRHVSVLQAIKNHKAREPKLIN